MPYVKDVSTADFEIEVLERSRELPVVVDFWAAWCGPCRTLGPMLERVTEEHGGTFELAKVDVDQNQQLAMQFGVQGIPTVIAFANGEPVDRFSGAIPEQHLRSWLAGFLPVAEDERVAEGADLLAAGDTAGAEKLFREVLAERPRDTEAGTWLASLLIDDDRAEEALSVLDQLDPSEETKALAAVARLTTKAEDVQSDGDIARASTLAATGEHQQALDILLQVVVDGGEDKEAARAAMLDVFAMLGDDSELTSTYRRRLANALF